MRHIPARPGTEPAACAVKIRNKIIILLSAVFALLALVEWGIERELLLPRFEQVELDAAHTAMRRIRYGVTQALAELQVSANDWGNWADTYHFLASHDDAYVQANLAASSLRQLHITELAFIDPAGRVVTARSLADGHLESGSNELFPGQRLAADSPWWPFLRDGRVGQALVATSRGVLLAAVSPVLDGYGQGPSRGMVFMGRLLTAAEVAALGARVQTTVVLEAARREGDAPLSAAMRVPRGSEAITLASDVLAVRHTFDDIHGQPVLTLRVDLPRTISAGARTTVRTARAFTFGAAIVVLLLMLYALEREVLGPLSRVTAHASALGAGDEPERRLELRRRDEIGTLAHELDRMLGRLADSRRRLIDHSFESGRAELSRGVLHNIGNAMTPLGVRVARLQERLRQAPIADLERALEEVVNEPRGTERQADLDEFVRLVATELADAVRQSEADVEVIARQSAAVQAALSDQSRSSRSANLIEPVDLPALVEQALEIVPDSARDAIHLVRDPSLGQVGTVQVARTVLRLVLQNLLINAAEAIRAAGTSRADVRLRAERTVVDGAPALSIRCDDQGIGIEPEDLPRIFERGFSTKGDASSRGIGLHWCATTIASLGGRIWATSDGRGRGATFHVILPVPERGSAAEPVTRAA